MVIFFWTPPHFWALAIKYKDDYAAAGIPMLPVVAPINKVEQQMWFHTISMVIVSFITMASANVDIWLYPANLVISAIFVAQVARLRRDDISRCASRIFHGSITYLSIYSCLLVVGALLK